MGLITVDDKKFLSLDWVEIEKLVDRLAGQISLDYCPDTIVGVLRGGVIVANLISDLLDVRDVYVVGCRSYLGLSSGDVKIYHDLYLKDLSGRKVIIVDDVSDTGNTLSTAINTIIRPRSPLELRSATVLIKPWTNFRPDYYVETTDAWIVFPWERFETVKLLAERFSSKMGRTQTIEMLAGLSRLPVEVVAKVVDRS